MDLTSLIIQLIGGAVGGNAAGRFPKTRALGRLATPSSARLVAASAG